MPDLDKWIRNNSLDKDDVCHLGVIVRYGDAHKEYGTWKCDLRDNGWMRIDDINGRYESLTLLSEKAKELFIKKLEDAYCPGQDIEGWCEYQRQIEKDD